MSTKLPEYYEVLCPDIETFDYIKALGTKYGYKFDCNDHIYIDHLPTNIILYTDHKRLHYNLYNTNAQDLIRLDEVNNILETLSKYLEKTQNLILELAVGGYKVKISAKDIEVGCQTISFEIVEKIYKQMVELQ